MAELENQMQKILGSKKGLKQGLKPLGRNARFLKFTQNLKHAFLLFGKVQNVNHVLIVHKNGCKHTLKKIPL